MNPNSTTNYIDKLAGFIKEFDRVFIDKTSMDHTAKVIADTYACAFSGIKTSAFKRAFAACDDLFGNGEFEVWGTQKKTSLNGAVFYNCLSISSTDYDEGHRAAVGHPASGIVPVAMALGEKLSKSKIEIFRSVIIGYEIATRFSMSRPSERINSYSSGRWVAMGSATVACVLMKLNTYQIVQALSNASILSPVMIGGSTDVSTGSNSKEGVAWAAQIGLQSAMFAKNNFVGPFLFVDEHQEYDKEILIANLTDNWLIKSNYFKPFACCRWLHPALSAAKELIEQNDIPFKEIESVRIKTFYRAKTLIGKKYPSNDIMAQFHLPYVIAIMLQFQKLTPAFFDDYYLKDYQTKSLIDKTEVITHSPYNDMFPEKLASAIEIETSEAVFEKEIIGAPWDYGVHPTNDELKEKFEAQTLNTDSLSWDWFLNYNAGS